MDNLAYVLGCLGDAGLGNDWYPASAGEADITLPPPPSQHFPDLVVVPGGVRSWSFQQAARLRS
jgi:hypothetical protein